MLDQIFFLIKVLLSSLLISLMIKYGFFNWAVDYPTTSSLILIFLPVIIILITLLIRQQKLTN